MKNNDQFNDEITSVLREEIRRLENQKVIESSVMMVLGVVMGVLLSVLWAW